MLLTPFAASYYTWIVSGFESLFFNGMTDKFLGVFFVGVFVCLVFLFFFFSVELICISLLQVKEMFWYFFLLTEEEVIAEDVLQKGNLKTC